MLFYDDITLSVESLVRDLNKRDQFTGWLHGSGGVQVRAVLYKPGLEPLASHRALYQDVFRLPD